MNSTILITLLVISGILFVGSVLLMTPKWWLGMGIGGASGGGDYWSKKSVEWTLKKTAIISLAIFMACALFLPYVD